MKEYNCPDCNIVAESCLGCPRTTYNLFMLEQNYPKVNYKADVFDFFPLNIEPCTSCSNNPKNGGNGMCNCTLPYIFESRIKQMNGEYNESKIN